MKQILMMMVLASRAYASDALQTELSCEAVVPSEMNDFGLRVDLLSNTYAWAKLVRVYESGYTGERLVTNANVPLQPDPSGERMIYRARELRLEVPAAGEGEGALVLRRNGSEERYELRCGFPGA